MVSYSNKLDKYIADYVIMFFFNISRICRDIATGVHYGVITCEGCKVCIR